MHFYSNNEDTIQVHYLLASHCEPNDKDAWWKNDSSNDYHRALYNRINYKQTNQKNKNKDDSDLPWTPIGVHYSL